MNEVEMADPEHVKILRSGVERWNSWRDEPPSVRPDLRDSNLILADLVWADLHVADLRGANLSKASLGNANLRGANLANANLSDADLSEANLSEANLSEANLRGANLGEVHLSRAFLGNTVFGNVDLSTTVGLEICYHVGPSIVDPRTLERSGKLPIEFLRGCGLSNIFIDNITAIFGGDPVQFYSCFISYSSADEEFAKRIHADLQDNGVRCWFAPEDLKIGDRIGPGIDESIRVHEKLVLILSEYSINSDWVKHEVEMARKKEEGRGGETVLIPIRVDSAVMEAEDEWPEFVARQRNIGDFTGWKNHDRYTREFDKLLKALKPD